jgi:hypothetical protein
LTKPPKRLPGAPRKHRFAEPEDWRKEDFERVYRRRHAKPEIGFPHVSQLCPLDTPAGSAPSRTWKWNPRRKAQQCVADAYCRCQRCYEQNHARWHNRIITAADNRTVDNRSVSPQTFRGYYYEDVELRARTEVEWLMEANRGIGARSLGNHESVPDEVHQPWLNKHGDEVEDWRPQYTLPKRDSDLFAISIPGECARCGEWRRLRWIRLPSVGWSKRLDVAQIVASSHLAESPWFRLRRDARPLVRIRPICSRCLGKTGRGRPKEGIRGDHLEDKLVNGVYVDWDYAFFVMELAEKGPDGTILTDGVGVKLNRGALRKVHEEVARRVPNANTKALAEHLGISERKARNLKTAVRAANSSKEGKEEVSPTIEAEIIERLDRIQGDVADIKQSNYRLEFRQLDAQEDAIESFDED